MVKATSRTFLTLLALPLAAQHIALAQQASLAPPQHVAPPLPEHAVTNRAFQGIPSMAVAPGGRLWANWYAGVTPGEDHNNYVVVSTSGNGGATWKEVLIIDPDGGGMARAFDPELWVSPDGRLFVFWAQMEKGRRDTQLGVWCMEARQADAQQPEWSRPRRITDGVMMCKPLTLATGEWVLPVSKWPAHDNSAQMIISNDRGESWALRGGCNVPMEARDADEHMFIERRDGSIWLLVRTKYGIGESVSTDRGKTWPELKPSAIHHPTARFFIRRLATGNLLLVKHGPLETRTSRSLLTAFISTDDGRTWSGGLMLDERLGVSYPDGQQTADGLIRVIYDFSRTGDRNILMATFREEDAAASAAISDAVRLRQLVSKASGGQEKWRAPPKPVNANATGVPMRKETSGTLTLAGAESPELTPGVKLFTDRDYVASELPEALKAAHFLRIAMNGTKSVTCKRAGTVWFLTPAPGRNSDSQTQALMDQGFEMVALPEVPLFNPASAANYCTLYQKDCSAGETILVDKWAVPVFHP
ncbi:MAG: exo-alpha-sialidase [Planctomycetes bacterium]|nr:exo-alpha-sialidase [Planctomycetota bacterium]